MGDVVSALLLSYVFIIVTMTLLWLLSIKIKNASIVDLYWGAGFGLIAVLMYMRIDQPNLWQGLLMILPVMWSLRLTIYLMFRNVGHGEDPRYTKLRSWVADEKSFNKLSFKKVFMLQGHIMWLVSTPVVVGLALPSVELSGLSYIGAAVCLFGIVFEAVADEQLRRFKANPNRIEKILKTGLWRYSRHPNYFGNATLWVGIFLVAAENHWALLTFFSPIIMAYFLIKVTGKETLERKMQKEKPDYKEYVASTSGFIPWFPK